ncbi:hypothetical protein KUTeg_018929 [Tegillarca granosa]|uniref:Carboxylesterase type B domain-containing protein n=1 Tax=Tegillarca granosa TaxID=220873 RepID=A0ABQ9EH03_TEGGR|nr:hypothetical protein KUTeg_018929 [Tegillarca granosa]
MLYYTIRACEQFAAILLAVISTVTGQKHHIVTTKSGPIKGVITDHAMGKLYTFFKIPFAKPPVGDLRFKKPEPIEPWNDVIDGTQQMPSCSQPMGLFDAMLPNTDVSEDCLLLNVFVPNTLSPGSKKIGYGLDSWRWI